MLDWISKEFLIALSGALAIVLVSLWSFPNPNSYGPRIEAKHQADSAREGQSDRQQPEATIASGREDQSTNRNDEVSEYWPILGRKLKITDTLLVLFTFTLWWSTRDLVKEAKTSSEKQLRAYVHVSVATMKPRGDFLDYYLEVKNFGQTPASDVKLRYMIKLCDFPPTNEPFNVPDDGPNVSSAILPPQIGMHDAFTPPQVLGPIQKGDFLAGRKAIYVFGIITYKDVFSKSRKTEFRYMAGGNVGLHSEGSLRICEDGNKAT